MTKRTKILLIILIPVLVVLLVLYLLVNAVYVPTPAAIVFPQGELTDSIFTEQNNKYTKNEDLKMVHEFQTVPYTVDVTEGDGAKVGSGTIYRIAGTEDFFIYVTEYNDSTNAQDVITSQFPAALLINYVPEMTRVTVQVDKKGFINGFSAEYIGETISASDGTEKRDAGLVGYALDMPDVEYAASHIYIGVGTTTVTTETLDACAQILSTVMNTVTKSEELETQRKQEAERKAMEEQAALISSLGEEGAQQEAPAGQEVQAPKTATIPIPVDQEYTTLTVSVDWDNLNPDAVLELFNPEKTVYYDPSQQDETSARFVLRDSTAGTYELHIANADKCGAIRTSHDGKNTSVDFDELEGEAVKTDQSATEMGVLEGDKTESTNTDTGVEVIE